MRLIRGGAMTYTSDGVSRSPIHLLHRASQCAELIFHSAVADRVTALQLAILLVIAEREGESQAEITEATHIDRSTTAEVMRRLVKKGLLQRRRSRADARAYELRLTDEGNKALEAAEPVARRIDARVLEALPKAHRQPFVAALAAVIKELEGTAGRTRVQTTVGDSGDETIQRGGAILSRHDVLGFAARTRENLDCIERTFKDTRSGHVVTQLVSSLLGLVVFPHEKHLDAELKEIRLDRLAVEGWPRWEISKGKCETLGSLVCRLRNGVPHGRLRFSSDSRELQEVTIEVEDWHPHAREPYWRALIGAADLRASASATSTLSRRPLGRAGRRSIGQQVNDRRKPAEIAPSSEQNQRSGLFVRR
jgi:DNA-binding MarR family transcriptional regulator